MTTLGSVLASVGSGWLLDRLSVPQTLLAAGGVCVLGAGVALIGLGGRKRP